MLKQNQNDNSEGYKSIKITLDNYLIPGRQDDSGHITEIEFEDGVMGKITDTTQWWDEQNKEHIEIRNLTLAQTQRLAELLKEVEKW